MDILRTAAEIQAHTLIVLQLEQGNILTFTLHDPVTITHFFALVERGYTTAMFLLDILDDKQKLFRKKAQNVLIVPILNAFFLEEKNSQATPSLKLLKTRYRLYENVGQAISQVIAYIQNHTKMKK